MKKRIKELDKKVSKGKSKETDNKKRERKRKPEFFHFCGKYNCHKNEKQRYSIEVSKISKSQMRRLKAI